ncbi:MAG: hypothetical protein HZB15_06210, partial [Actinobacteria bacterium]|nr:hypothetical protein [Actinomycetota bacterium]
SDDPNQQIVDAMSVPERRAYYLALYGGLITVNDDGELEKPEAVDARGGESEIGESCSSQASEAVYGESTPSRDESGGADPFAALEQEMSALYDRVAADQRLVDATTAWAGCMADAGFPGYSELTDPVVDVDGRAGDVMGDQRDPSSADPTELQELRTFEIAVATADFECRIAYDDIDHLVRTELEQQFVDEHRAELEQFRDAMAA